MHSKLHRISTLNLKSLLQKGPKKQTIMDEYLWCWGLSQCTSGCNTAFSLQYSVLSIILHQHQRTNRGTQLFHFVAASATVIAATRWLRRKFYVEWVNSCDGTQRSARDVQWRSACCCEELLFYFCDTGRLNEVVHCNFNLWIMSTLLRSACPSESNAPFGIQNMQSFGNW